MPNTANNGAPLEKDSAPTAEKKAPFRQLTYVEYLALSPKEKQAYMREKRTESFKRGFVNFFRKIGLFFVHLYQRFVRFVLGLAYAFKHGDVWTRLSFVLPGTSFLARKQIGKGLLYYGITAAFILYMVFFGSGALQSFATLGTRMTKYYCATDDGSAIAAGFENIAFTSESAANIYCGDQGYTQLFTVFGDNSSLILLYGLVTYILLILFVIFYFKSISKAIDTQEEYEAGQHLPTAFEDFRSLVGSRFHLLLLTLPVAGIVIFTIIPIMDTILVGFTNYNVNHQYPANMFTWIGFTNFANLFAGANSNFSYTFVHILGWTLVWAVFATFLNFFLGMILAMLINKKGIKLKKLWRTLFVLSIAVPQFVSLMTWNKFLSDGGLIEQIMKMFGWMNPAAHLTVMTDPTSARIMVILVNVWVGIPYTILSTTGILMNVPEDLYESASIDGAGPARQYFKITLPYVLFVMGPSLITQFVGNINNFNVIYFLTGGAPATNDYLSAGKTDLLVTWLYKLTVNQSNFAYASVIGIMIFVISAIFSLIAYRFSSSNQNEEDFA